MNDQGYGYHYGMKRVNFHVLRHDAFLLIEVPKLSQTVLNSIIFLSIHDTNRDKEDENQSSLYFHMLYNRIKFTFTIDVNYLIISERFFFQNNRQITLSKFSYNIKYVT